MTQKEMAYRIEELQLKAEQAHSLQNTLFAAIFRQEDYAVEEFEWAFVMLGEMTYGAVKDLNDLKEKAFENLKKDG